MSANTNRVFSSEFKLSVAQRIAAGESVSALHHEFGIKRSVLYRWRDAYLREGAAGLNRTPGRPPGTPNRPGRVPPSKAPADPAAAKLAELERKVGQQALQIDFLRGAFKRVVLDAYSRRIVGWEIGEDLRAELALAALDRALADRAVERGIVHHSDRGVQYCSDAYVSKLDMHGFQISMSRSGNPYDNARAESFMKTLKCEEVYLRRYRDLEDVRASIGYFIDEVYNRKRLHSALGYLAPDVFEASLASEAAS